MGFETTKASSHSNIYWPFQGSLCSFFLFWDSTILQGIWSLSWCPHDPNWLLSCGKDNQIFCWNVTTGQIVEELHTTCDVTYNVLWSPHLPSILSASSLDRRVTIFSLHDIGASEKPYDPPGPSQTPAATATTMFQFSFLDILPDIFNSVSQDLKTWSPQYGSLAKQESLSDLVGNLFHSENRTPTRCLCRRSLTNKCFLTDARNYKMLSIKKHFEPFATKGMWFLATFLSEFTILFGRANQALSQVDKETWNFLSSQFTSDVPADGMRFQLGLDAQHILEKIHARLADLPQVISISSSRFIRINWNFSVGNYPWLTWSSGRGRNPRGGRGKGASYVSWLVNIDDTRF